VFSVVLILGVLAFFGFAVGVRPRRQDRPERSLTLLMTFSVIVLLAAWVLVSEGWFRRLKAWGVDELDMLGVHAVLGLACLAGSLVLFPAWGYVIGRTASRRRVQGNRKVESVASLDGW
jgi:hypothetical protein